MSIQPPESTTLSPADDVAEDLKHGLRQYMERADGHDKQIRDYTEAIEQNRGWAANARSKAAALSDMMTRLGIEHEPPYAVVDDAPKG
jgi:hypothetical protein